jgi:hypothetical protein
MTSRTAPADGPAARWWPDQAAVSVREALLAHPAVARVDAGVFGATATYTAGGRIIGVWLGAESDPVEIAVVLRLDRPVPEIVAELRRAVRTVVGAVGVDVTVSDVLLASSSSRVDAR